MASNDIILKNAKSITINGKSVKIIKDELGRIIWEKLSPVSPYCRTMFTDAFNSGSDFFLPLDNAQQV